MTAAPGTDSAHSHELDGRRILVVDDSKLIRRVQKQALEGAGARIGEAGNGVEALAAMRSATAESDAYNMAMVDLSMPVMDGIELLREIRADPAIRRTPVVVVSSENDEAVILEAARHGISGYVAKDAGAETMLEMACRALQSGAHPPVSAPYVGLNVEEVKELLAVVRKAAESAIAEGMSNADSAEDEPVYNALLTFLSEHCPRLDEAEETG
jgi:two-component system, chemotaxis family, chemotaxis protein CheY